MKIVLVIEDEKNKNVLFVTENRNVYTSEDAIKATLEGQLEGTYVVQTSEKARYVRSNPNKTKLDNLDELTISISQLREGLLNYDLIQAHPSLKEYEKIRLSNLQTSDDVIFIDGVARKTKKEVITHIKKYKSLIIDAASKQNIDPKVLTAILIDEYLRMGPNDWFDWAAKLGLNTSVGVAQIKVETARNIIKMGYYNPNPDDQKLNPDAIKTATKNHLYQYLKNPNHNIHFSAAIIRANKEYWNTTKHDELASLYSYWTPKSKKKVVITKRGTQIATEFYAISEELLSE